MFFSYCVQIQVQTFSNSGGVALWNMVQLKDPEVRPGGAEQRPAAIVWEELRTWEHQAVGRMNLKMKIMPTALYMVFL